jgi:hypothetical protein
VISGERADEPARELSTECCLEPLARLGLHLGQVGCPSAVVEDTAGGFPVVGRRDVDGHGSLSIVLTDSAGDP